MLLRHWLGTDTAYVAVQSGDDDAEHPLLDIEIGDGCQEVVVLSLFPNGLPEELPEALYVLALLRDAIDHAEHQARAMLLPAELVQQASADAAWKAAEEPKLGAFGNIVQAESERFWRGDGWRPPGGRGVSSPSLDRAWTGADAIYNDLPAGDPSGFTRKP